MKLGDVIDDRFEIDQHASAGGMGEVYRARDRATGDVVGIKVLLPERAPEVARFEREARLLAELRHPGIVRYVAHGVTATSSPYIAMEWLDGCDLASFLVKRRPTIEESVMIAARAAEALGFAHERGVVHRDLKPTNLFLVGGDVNRLKLLDFGIAWLCEEARMTQAGVLVGTPAYMAPEQARSDQEVDARADVFSLGCVLFECISGRPAFSGERLMAILAKILIQDPPRARELRPDVPAELDALLAKMLAKEPEGRPRDGSEVAAALASIGALITPPGASRRLATAARRTSLTGGERRALSVVLIGPGRREGSGNAGAASDDELRAIARDAGGRLEHLADGSAVVTFAGVGLASDQAAQAAQCALALRARTGSTRPIALATGSGELSGGVPLGEAIDKAVRMISSASAHAHPRAGAPVGGLATVALDEVTAALLDARFDVVEGEAGLFLAGERELAEGTRTLLGKPTPCVGRDRELTNLEVILAECVEDSVAQAVLMTAPAGAGKSRLAYELLRKVRQARPDVQIWLSRGDSLRAGSAFAMLSQALRVACGIREGEAIDVRRDKLRARVASRVGAADQARVTEFLGELCAIPYPEANGARLQAARRDPQLMSDQMRVAWEDFLRAECAVNPVLIVLEDLHWGDLPTVRFIDGALRRLGNLPWMVLALARPEVSDVFPKVWAERGALEIRLKGLTVRASQRLARQVLGADANAETIDLIVTLADGNAFYLEELIRATAEQRRGALPQTVVSMVQSRLGALDVESRRVLRAASIFGDVLWPGGVSALLGGGLRTPAVHARLAELAEREVLVRRQESRFPGEEELMFRHALLREGAYAMVTEEDRSLGHRLAGEWLESRGEQEPMVLAEHFERGNDPARAAGYYARAAELANKGGDTASALRRAERGLSCCEGAARIDLLGLICETYVWHPELASTSAPYAEEVMRLAAPGSVPWARAALTRLMGALQRRRPDEFMDTVQAVAKAEPLPDAVGHLVWALGSGVFYLDRQGLIDDAERMLARAHSIVDPLGESDRIAAGWLHSVHAIRDAYAKEDPAAGLRAGRACDTHFVAIGKQRGIAIAQVYSGMNLWFLGEYDEAIRVLRGLVAADADLGELSSSRPFCLAYALMDRGDLSMSRAEATALAESRYAQKRDVDDGLGRWCLAEVMRRQGELADAEREARAALSLLAVLPLDQTGATATLAAILLDAGRIDAALDAASGAMARYKATRACGWFRGQALRLVYAECLAAAGKTEEANTAIEDARAHLLTNASKISDPAHRRSFLERVPENARTLELARRWIGLPGGLTP